MTEKYRSIADKLELELRQMRAEGKTRLPSEQELAASCSCSRQTVRAALEVLSRKGLIVKRRGSGSYIADKVFSSKQVFFITEDCDRYQSPALISGLKDRLAQHRYELKVFSTGGNPGEEADVLSRAVSERPAALVIEPVCDVLPDPNYRLIEDVASGGTPVIYCNSTCNIPDGSVYITPDFRDGGRTITTRLLKNGSRKPACIFRMDDSSGLEGYKGYIDALSDLSIAFDGVRCLLLSYKEQKEIFSGYDRRLVSFAKEILKNCDSVICQNGIYARLIAGILKSHGIGIAVASMDSSYYTDRGESGILSPDYDLDALCKALSKTCISAAEGRDVKSIMVPVKGLLVSQIAKPT